MFINAVQAENLKLKRTFSKKIILIAPLFFAMYAIFTTFFISEGNKYFISMVFNWWPLLFMPFGTALLCALSHEREKKAGNYKSSDLYNVNKTTIWLSKITVIAAYTLLATIELFIVVIVSNTLVNDNSISDIKILEASILCWIASLAFIPIHLFISLLFGTAVSIVVSVIGIVAGVVAATETFLDICSLEFRIKINVPCCRSTSKWDYTSAWQYFIIF